jgi:transcriptional regulator with XRE-family HTH domain
VHKIRDEKLLKRFARNLKNARKERGMSQEDLADKSGLALSQIARIETARLNTTIGTVYALLKALGTNANELFQ